MVSNRTSRSSPIPGEGVEARGPALDLAADAAEGNVDRVEGAERQEAVGEAPTA